MVSKEYDSSPTRVLHKKAYTIVHTLEGRESPSERWLKTEATHGIVHYKAIGKWA